MNYINNISSGNSIYYTYYYFVTADIIQNERDPCNPSPCGPNAICLQGVCSCIEEHTGDPYLGCRPECVLSTDCTKDKACVTNKCINPCRGICATTAICNVVNHIAMCSCPHGTTGNAFYDCTHITGLWKLIYLTYL